MTGRVAMVCDVVRNIFLIVNSIKGVSFVFFHRRILVLHHQHRRQDVILKGRDIDTTSHSHGAPKYITEGEGGGGELRALKIKSHIFFLRSLDFGKKRAISVFFSFFFLIGSYYGPIINNTPSRFEGKSAAAGIYFSSFPLEKN